MRMDKEQKLTAKDVVNTYSEEKLANIIWEYGEEKFSRQIAKNICKSRQQKSIETTGELVQIIKKSIPLSKQKDGHPAKRTFQAIRIEVNNEIEPLYNTILDCINCLNKNGRLAVLTCGAKSLGKIINKKPIEATKEETERNSRSKSAKLRIFEKR